MTKRKIATLAMVIVGLAALMSGDLTPRSLGAPSWSPAGRVDAIDDEGFVTGWVADPANPSATVTVNIYIDGQAPSNLFAVVQANQPTPPCPNQNCLAYGTAHGFRFQVPTQYMEDGTQHNIYASAVEPGTGQQALLFDAHGFQDFKFPFIDVNSGGYAQGDVGANINAANNYLSYSGRRGIIHVYSGGTISTQAVISPRNTVRFHDGVYQPSLNGPAILLKDHTAVIGDGWNTILKENSVPSNGIIITSDGAWPAPLAERNYDITIKNFKVEGHSAQAFTSDRGPIVLGNVKRAIISGIWFDSPHGFGTAVGGPARRWYYGDATTKYLQLCQAEGCAPVTTPENEDTDIDLFASNVWMIDNKFTHVASQDASTVNAQFVTVSGNFFEKPGQTGGPGNTLIDIEPNTTFDSAEYTIIENNHAETSQAFQSGHGNFIAYQPANPNRGGPAIIRNNQLNSPALVTNLTSNGVILKPESIDVLIYGNSFYGCGQSAVYANGYRLYVYNNLFDSCGGGGTPAMTLERAFYSLFFNDTFLNSMGGSTLNDFKELSPSDHNTFANNSGAIYNLTGPNSHVQQGNPTFPFVYPRVTTPSISVLSDGRIQITAPTSVFFNVMSQGLYLNAPYSVNVEIHYTLDGTTPTLFSPRYFGPLKGTGTAVIKAKAFIGGLENSNESTYVP